MKTLTLPTAFARLSPTNANKLIAGLRGRMAIPPRFYHNEEHIEAVLSCVWTWTDATPGVPLLAAALYHDAVYDATRTDNEAQSALFCRAELLRIGARASDIADAEHLILATADHSPVAPTPDKTLLLDADLYIFGASPDEYDAYVRGIRAEYAHVSEPNWNVGRGRVLEMFLSRPRLFIGNWQGLDEREAVARVNLRAEYETLRR